MKTFNIGILTFAILAGNASMILAQNPSNLLEQHTSHDEHVHDHGEQGHDHDTHKHDNDEHRHDHHHGEHIHDHDCDEHKHDNQKNELGLWLAATASIVIISLCEILGVAVTPLFMRKENQPFYKHLIQFLVALAVGTMAGDALLHLYPHALLAETHQHGHNHHEHGPHRIDYHNASIWKGFAALVALIVFYLLEQIVTIINQWRFAQNAPMHSNGIAKSYVQYQENSSEDSLDQTAIPSTKDQTITMHHGHSHAFSDVSSSSSQISSMAWMVIFGDGIHNLADGLALGAAFSDSYASGLSTSIAIFCHELPHEIGDFAMLLGAGMTWKQAALYSTFSSALAFIGMCLGRVLGNLDTVTPWIFTTTAGIFLYVALVDMIPQLHTGNDHKEPKQRAIALFIQVLGMTLGGVIMLLIAIYEHEMMHIF